MKKDMIDSLFVGICWGERETFEKWQRQDGCESERPDPGNTGTSSANGQGKLWMGKTYGESMG